MGWFYPLGFCRSSVLEAPGDRTLRNYDPGWAKKGHPEGDPLGLVPDTELWQTGRVVALGVHIPWGRHDLQGRQEKPPKFTKTWGWKTCASSAVFKNYRDCASFGVVLPSWFLTGLCKRPGNWSEFAAYGREYQDPLGFLKFYFWPVPISIPN